MKDHYPLSPEELAHKLNSARDAQAKRYKGIFEPIMGIARRAFAKRPLTLQDESINDSAVREVASALEAALVMAENTDPGAEIALTIRNYDLSHFVGYMRAVDHYARALAERNGKLIARLEELNERKNPDGQGSPIEEIAQARHDDYDPYAGSAHAREGRALGGQDRRERSPKHPWNLPMAEGPSQVGVDLAGEAQSTTVSMRRYNK